MKLANGIMRPGTVVEVLYGGCIKAAAPGLFSITDDPDDLPPIMPLVGSGTSGGSTTIKRGDEVWVLNFSDNLQQLYWIKKYSYDAYPSNVPMFGRDVEIMCNIKSNGDWCSIYFEDGAGWVITKGESRIQVAADGSILLYTPEENRCIHINDSNISIGSFGTSAHPAAYGDVIEEILTSLCLLLNGIATKALANPHTAAIGTELLKTLPQIVNRIQDIPSDNVTID